VKIYILVSIYNDGIFCGIEGVYSDKVTALYQKDALGCASDLTSTQIWERIVDRVPIDLLDRPDTHAYYNGDRLKQGDIKT
jgi:hypothetical protein